MIGAARRAVAGLFWRVRKAGASWIDAWRSGEPVSMLGTMGWSSAERAMTASGVSAAVRLTAGNVAQLPLHAYRMTANGDRERVRGHWCEQLLERPNSWQSGFEFRRMLAAHCELHSNAYALKRYEGARVVALIPFPDPARMRVEQPNFDQPPIYTYSDPKLGQRPYAASEIFHLRDLSLDGITGLNRLAEMRSSVALALASEMFGISFFENGGRPGPVVKYPRKMTDDEKRGFIQSWQATQGGPQRAHLPFVIEYGGEIVPMPVASNKDSQLLELRSFEVEDIACRRFGAPPHMVGLTEKQTSWGTGVEQQTLGYLKFSLVGRLCQWESTIQFSLLDPIADRGVFMEHVVDGLLRGDFKTRMEGYAISIQNGIMSPNEVRKLENRAPREDGKGDEYWKPSNMVGGDEPQPDDEARVAQMPSELPEHRWRRVARTAARLLADREVA